MKHTILAHLHVPKHFLLQVLIFSLAYFFLLYFYYQKIGSFGCFDDCFNYMGGWFVLKGKVLYQQIYYNHQPLAAYISALIQGSTNPQSIYQLVLYHRLFIYILSYCFVILLIYRFGSAGLFVSLLFESSKYYFFGDRFLAEGMITYPLIYLFGICWQYFQGKIFLRFDIYLASFFAWFIIFLREPLIPLAGILFALTLFLEKRKRVRAVALGVFLLLTCGIFLFFPLPDYLFNVVEVNRTVLLSGAFALSDLFPIFFYPLYLFFVGNFSILHIYLLLLSAAFCLLCVRYFAFKKRIFPILFLIFVLGFSNLRPGEPGKMFYEAFHMLPWYGLFLSGIIFLSREVLGRGFAFFVKIESVIVIVAFLFLMLSPTSYIREKTDREFDFFSGYNQYFSTGEVIKSLSAPSDTLFLDGWNDLIYWQAQRTSPYQYSWYTSFMPQFAKYTNAREDLLANHPPDFFYGACREWPFSKVSDEFLRQYARFFFSGKPTCLYIKQDRVKSLGEREKALMTSFGYSITL